MRLGLSLSVVLLCGGLIPVTAEDIVFPPKDIKCYGTRTTTIDILRLPDLKSKTLPPTVEWKTTVWEGQCFKDEAGRRWCLMRGPAVSGKPASLTGWALKSVHGQEFFYTQSGSLFGPEGKGGNCAKGVCRKPAADNIQAATRRLGQNLRQAIEQLDPGAP